MASAAVGTGKAVTVAGYSLSGGDALNYSVTQPTGVTVAITAKALTISGVSATDRVYNGTTALVVTGGALVGVESGDTVTLGGTATGTVESAAVGSGKAVTVAGYSLSGGDALNYSVTQPTGVTVAITAKALTIAGVSATDRVYNGTTTVAVTGGSLVGVESGDTVTLGGTATGTVASAAVGTGKAVTVAGYSLSGGGASNYSVTPPTGVTVGVTPALVTVTATSANKTTGENDPALIYTSSPTQLVAGNVFTGALSRAAGETVGTYAINQGSLSAGENYTITFVSATFTISSSGGQTPNLTGFGLHEQKVASNGARTVKIVAPISTSSAPITYRCDPPDNASINDGSSIITLIESPVRIYAEQAAFGDYTSGSVSINLTWVQATPPDEEISSP